MSFFNQFLNSIFDAAAATPIWVWIAIASALLYVVFAALENSWCWLFGIISSAIYVWYNFELKLYNDTWLSLYYCAVGIYGWHVWIKGKSGDKSGAILHKIKFYVLAVSIAIGITGTLVLGKLTSSFTNSPLPYFDAALTSFSLVATFLTARKILENWIFWIAIDAAYVVIYWIRLAPMTSILFLVYTFIAIYGFLKWKKKLEQSFGA